MIRGVMNARNEIQIPLPILDVTCYEQVFEVVLDSGFNGSMTLPAALIAALQLPWLKQDRVEFADGRVEWIDTYQVVVVWDGVERSLEIQSIGSEPLIGMALLVGYDLRARVVVGGSVEIEAIP